MMQIRNITVTFLFCVVQMKRAATSSSVMENYEHMLMCLICRSLFDDHDHQPKFLPCHHTFCKECLREYVRQMGDDIECPSCRKVATIPAAGVAALQTNFYAKYIQNLVYGSGERQFCRLFSFHTVFASLTCCILLHHPSILHCFTLSLNPTISENLFFHLFHHGPVLSVGLLPAFDLILHTNYASHSSVFLTSCMSHGFVWHCVLFCICYSFLV